MHAVHNELQDVGIREPAQVLDFLGSIVDTLSMELWLPLDKMKRIHHAQVWNREDEHCFSALYISSSGCWGRWTQQLKSFSQLLYILQEPTNVPDPCTIDQSSQCLRWRSLYTRMPNWNWGGGSVDRKKKHINCLELLAATLYIPVQTFAENLSKISVWLQIDNTMAVVYVNNMAVVDAQVGFLSLSVL